MADPVVLSPAELHEISRRWDHPFEIHEGGYAPLVAYGLAFRDIVRLLAHGAALTAARDEAEALTEDWRQVVDRIDERNEALEAALLAAERDRDRSRFEIQALHDWAQVTYHATAMRTGLGDSQLWEVVNRCRRALSSPPPSPEGPQ